MLRKIVIGMLAVFIGVAIASAGYRFGKQLKASGDQARAEQRDDASRAT